MQQYTVADLERISSDVHNVNIKITVKNVSFMLIFHGDFSYFES